MTDAEGGMAEHANPYFEIVRELGIDLRTDPWSSMMPLSEEGQIPERWNRLVSERPNLAQHLDALTFAPAGRLHHYEVRRVCRRVFAYAIPGEGALGAIANLGGAVVEIGAGTGYWAALLAARGVEVLALDNKSWKGDNGNGIQYGRWHSVRRGSPLDAGRSDAAVLLLCWPPYNTSMSRRALSAFRGLFVAYVGEGEGGCTGCDRFHRALGREWSLLREVPIPQWPGLRDRLWIYGRGGEGDGDARP